MCCWNRLLYNIAYDHLLFTFYILLFFFRRMIDSFYIHTVDKGKMILTKKCDKRTILKCTIFKKSSDINSIFVPEFYYTAVENAIYHV